ncbi:MAG TPA: hypothetical protein VGR20_02885 [Acidimicrobiia bacterium]|nr:hypothetical protein [Acidimicrobiia bacterium]
MRPTMVVTGRFPKQRMSMNGLLESLLVTGMMVLLELALRALIRQLRPGPRLAVA